MDALGEIIETMAGVDDFEIAETTWLAAVERWPARKDHAAPRGARGAG